MANAISGLAPVQQAYQPKPPAPTKPKAPEAPAQHKADTVTISAQGKQTAQLRTGDYKPAEEAKEAPVAKANETQAGKK